MSGFSADWLSLREPADHRARDEGLLRDLGLALEGRRRPSIVDLGCGTGSNLRAVAPRLGPEQHWRLVDHDPALLEAARARLSSWADTAEPRGEGLSLSVGESRVEVSFIQADLAAGVEPILATRPDLVTAAALFDLVSVDWIARFAQAVTDTGAAFYTALTYDGVEEWSPPHPADAAMLRAFHAHQGGDKGFGPSAGPGATVALEAAFAARGYRVSRARSPWRLGPDDTALVDELTAGAAAAVRETGLVPETIVADWQRTRRLGAVIGHEDLLALPPLP